MDQPAITKRILSDVDPDEFVGRSAESQRLLNHARGDAVSSGLAILVPPGAGSSELLKQVFDRLFLHQNSAIPFYFRISGSDGSPRAAAVRFLHDLLTQTVAFRRRDPSILEASPDLSEILRLSTPDDGKWIAQLIDSVQREDGPDDARSFVRHCLSAPLRAAAAGAQTLVLIDDVHETLNFDGGREFFDDLSSVFELSSAPIVFSGHRRFLYGRTSFPLMRMEKISFAEAGKLAQTTAARFGVPMNDQTRDLMAVQLGCSPLFIRSLLASALSSGTKLLNFAATEQLYTDELFGGRLGRRFDDLLDKITPDSARQAAIIRSLRETKDAPRSRVSESLWKNNIGLKNDELAELLDSLFYYEIVNLDAGHVIFDEQDTLLSDYVESRSALEVDGGSRARTIGAYTAANIKRAPQLMARFYRKNSSIGLLGIIKAFDGRDVPTMALDYARFRDKLKGAPDSRAAAAIRLDNSVFRLPQIVFAANTSAYYPKIDEICDPERSVTAIGVSNDDEQPEVVWLAAEIDSKLEADREITEFWCDRLEMVAATCGFTSYRIWLIAPEGFSPTALEILAGRSAFGSSRKQAEILSKLLLQETDRSENAPDVYEFVVPMGDDTEMIAAHTVEEIARRHQFPAKAINQIKTALVEACINAAEHSLSPDRRISQTFSIDDERLTITVSNRGVRLKDSPKRRPSNDGRRGWGLKLIKSLMDEVRIENTDDGTRITMVKNIRESSRAAAGSRVTS